MLAIWALADVNEGDGGFALIPASHKNYVETPKDVLSGADDMGLTVEPSLKAGDLLLCAESTLHEVKRGRGRDRSDCSHPGTSVKARVRQPTLRR